MAETRLKLTVREEGQRYVDALIKLHPKPESPCARAVRLVFRRPLPPVLIAGFERTPLRWVSPGKKIRG